MDDLRVVLDAAGSERAVLFGLSEGAALSAVFAATYPERTASLILVGGFARLLHDDGLRVGRLTRGRGGLQRACGRDLGRQRVAAQALGAERGRRPGRAGRVEPHAGLRRHAVDRDRLAAHGAGHRRAPRAPGDPRSHSHPAPRRRPDHPGPARPLPRRAHPRCPLRRAAARRPSLVDRRRRHPRRGPVVRRRRPGRRDGRPRAGHCDVHRHRRLDHPRRRARRPALARPGRGARPARARPPGALPRTRGQDDGRRLPRHLRRAGPGDPLRLRGPRCRAPARARAARGAAHRRVRDRRRRHPRDRGQHRRARRHRGGRRRGAGLADGEGPGCGVWSRVRRSRRARAEGRARASGASTPWTARRDPGDRPGHLGDHLPRLRRAGPRGRARLSRVRPALPAARLGRARRRRDLGGHARGGARGARRGRDRRPWADRDRHHQPARDGGCLGPPHRRAAAPRDRLAGPPHRGALRRAARRRSRAARARAHRARARPVLLGHQDRVADPPRRRARRRRLRDDRLVARPQAHRRARHRLLERLAHAAVRHRPAALGPRAVRAARRPGREPARAATERRRLRRDLGVRRLGAGGRHRRRPAGGALRAGLPRAGTRQEHLRHRQLRAAERGCRSCRTRSRGCSPRSPGAWRGAWTTRSRRRSS